MESLIFSLLQRKNQLGLLVNIAIRKFIYVRVRERKERERDTEDIC